MASVFIRVSDFVIIRGDSSRRIGDRNQIWEQNFRIPEHPTGFTITHSFLTYMVKGLTVATTNPQIRINNTVVGAIQRATGANWNHWFTQTVTIASGGNFPLPLHKGDNELEIRAVTYPDANANDLFDDFFLRNVIVHYNYSVEVGPGVI